MRLQFQLFGWLMVREVFERVSETAREAIEIVSGRRDVFVVTKSLYIMDSLSERQSR